MNPGQVNFSKPFEKPNAIMDKNIESTNKTTKLDQRYLDRCLTTSIYLKKGVLVQFLGVTIKIFPFKTIGTHFYLKSVLIQNFNIFRPFCNVKLLVHINI